MPSEYRNELQLGAQEISNRCTKFYGIAALFVLFTVSSWLLVILLGVDVPLTNYVLHISVTAVIVIVCSVFAAMSLADMRPLPLVDWVLTLVLVTAVTLWPVRIIANVNLDEYFVLFGCVTGAMIILVPNVLWYYLVVLASFVLIWWLVFLVLGVIVICLIFFAENRTMAAYLLAIIFYPLFFSLTIFTGMSITSGRYDTRSLTLCLIPARSVYFNFVL